MKPSIKFFALALAITGCLLSFKPKPKKGDDKFVSAMEQSIQKLEKASTKEQVLETTNQFERIAAVENKEWLPDYWAAYGYLQAVRLEKDNTQKDALLDKADSWIEKGEKTLKNDELEVIKAMSAQARLPVDPMNRWAKYGPVVGSSLESAKKINAENPRIYLVLGLNTLFTPEQFGGGKKNALPIFQTSSEKFKKFTPTSSISPKWGVEELNYFIGQCNK
jgi:hypothetical protein